MNKQWLPIKNYENKYEVSNTGLVTSEQLEEESKSCIWIECVDEGRSTIGYMPCCKGTYKGVNQ